MKCGRPKTVFCIDNISMFNSFELLSDSFFFFFQLYSLLSFVAPEIFRLELMEEFVEKYSDIANSSGI